MKAPLFVLATLLLLGACTSTASPPGDAAVRMRTQVGEAARTPLNDLNLVKAEIPPVLVAASKGPYAAPADAGCAALAAEVQALDAVLGADLDTPVTPVNPSLIERGAHAVGDVVSDATVGTVRRAVDVVPYRRWVRKLSGAEKYSREVAAAIAAGTIRRAFLKGMGQAAGCTAPAAPRP